MYAIRSYYAGGPRKIPIRQFNHGVNSAEILGIMNNAVPTGVLAINRLPKTNIFLDARVNGELGGCPRRGTHCELRQKEGDEEKETEQRPFSIFRCRENHGK